MIRKLRKFDYVKPKAVFLLRSYEEKVSLLSWGPSDLPCSILPGGLSFGLGFTFEDLLREKEKTLNPSPVSYKIPMTLDMVPLEAHIVEGPYEAGPFGAKAVGEPASVPIAAAIANAIGVRTKDLPITPDKILAALKERAS
jgi:xanthine dehydrogenase molybdopterin-binding subunit B